MSENQYINYCNRIMAGIRHAQKLRTAVVDAGPGKVTLKMPWQDGVVGDRRTGALHGGAIFSLVDQAGGFAAFLATYPDVRVSPTLDLRIDHMRKSEGGKDLYSDSECYRITKNIAFTRSVLHEGDRDDPVAICVGSYMLLDSGKEQGWLK